MIRRLSTLDYIDPEFLKAARIKSILELQCKKPFVLVSFGKIVGVVVCEKRGGRFWVDRFYVENIKQHLKSAYALLKEGLMGAGYNKKVFYGEIEKANPKIVDLFYKNCEVVSENDSIITFKRKFDVSF